ncbi:MAG: DUF2065 domain-containing protein [Nitrospinota bacterium]|nr:DUF2065 domain-containing protein [Nitrospinota bacterium]
MSFWLSVIGVVCVIEGGIYFISPQGVKELSKRILFTPEPVLRRIGFLMMVVGLILAYLGRRGL